MDNALAKFLTVVDLIWWPINKLINAGRIVLSPILRLVVFFLSPIWIVGSFLVLPIVHLVRGLFRIITLPLQVKWLERIETLYIYLGTAGLIGCITGAVLYFAFQFLSSSLSIDTASKGRAREGRTTAEFRTARREKQHGQTLAPNPPIPVVVERAPGRRGRGLLSQTIIEEDDSDF